MLIPGSRPTADLVQSRFSGDVFMHWVSFSSKGLLRWNLPDVLRSTGVLRRVIKI